ncbi:MAG: DUF2235 domain-containing protein [Planctomycetota bacterium]
MMPGKKNIIVCSDGTGQYGGMLNPSNVWRFYQALDKETQACIHDDGVGSGSGRFIRTIGGAFGFGISRNIKQIYKFLISQYDPEVEPNIYLIGFSRGAFTVRVVAQMICLFGIPNVKGQDPEVIDDVCDQILRGYKTANTEAKKGIQSGIAETFAKNYSIQNIGDKKVDSRKVHFLGVWDTVEALGLPLDEFTQAFNTLFPLKFRSNRPNDRVENIYHALSIDEERRTFRPKMFDENGLSAARKQQIRQVWFPGCHAHVGGGYAKDQLAFVALLWMIKHGEKHDLKFNQQMVGSFRTQSSFDGLYTDSRSGMRMFYRYGPRRIAEICQKYDVEPVIHQSTFDRIAHQIDGYSPSALHQVNQNNKLKIDSFPSVGTSQPATIVNNPLDMTEAIQFTWVRSIVFIGMFISVFFGLGWGIANGLVDKLVDPKKLRPIFGWMPQFLMDLENLILKSIKSFLPEFLAFIFDGLAKFNGLFLTLLVSFSFFFLVDQVIKQLIKNSAAKGLRDLRISNQSTAKPTNELKIGFLNWFLSSPAFMIATLAIIAYLLTFSIFILIDIEIAKRIAGGFLLFSFVGLMLFVGWSLWNPVCWILGFLTRTISSAFGWVGMRTGTRNAIGFWREYLAPLIGFASFFTLLIFVSMKLWVRTTEFWEKVKVEANDSDRKVTEVLDESSGHRISVLADKIRE